MKRASVADAFALGFDGGESRMLQGSRLDLVRAVADLRRLAAAAGITFTLASAYRSVARQAEIYADVQARRARGEKTLPAAKPGNSKHNYGAAVDVAIVTAQGMTSTAALRELGGFAGSVGLEWGGRYSDPDPVHFALPLSLAELQADPDVPAADASARGVLPRRCPTCGSALPAGVTHHV